jgi:hypothetical protein
MLGTMNYSDVGVGDGG